MLQKNVSNLDFQPLASLNGIPMKAREALLHRDHDSPILPHTTQTCRCDNGKMFIYARVYHNYIHVSFPKHTAFYMFTFIITYKTQWKNKVDRF